MMSTNLAVKKDKVSELRGVVESSSSVVVAEYRGLTSEKLTELRHTARDKKVFVKVFKNTLARIAVKDSDHECVTPDLKGPVILAFSTDEPGSAAKLIQEFAKENEIMVVKSLSLSGKRLDADQIEAVAKLPTFEEAIAMLMSCMQAPTRQLATACQETYGRLARVLNAYAEKQSA
tara:strand:- start:1350 stop:1877 length:528 start_codon:yes stop_codon:yes gene_type:complete